MMNAPSQRQALKTERSTDTKEWAKEVLTHKTTFLAGGTVPDAWHTSRSVKVPAIFKHQGHSAQHTVPSDRPTMQSRCRGWFATSTVCMIP